MYKVDFHTHSTSSHDGGITDKQYDKILQEGVLDVVAITDHNSVEAALRLAPKYPGKIIVGEEIMTTEGEVIGLFLKKRVTPFMPFKETLLEIKAQGGLVYIPHPLETLRHGVQKGVLEANAALIDIIEVCNGRALFQDRGPEAKKLAESLAIATAAASDGHRAGALGKTYTLLNVLPTQETLPATLERATLVYKKPSLGDLLAPKYYRYCKKS